MTDKPLVYLVLGAPGSGRREIVADLIESGVSADDVPVVFTAAAEAERGIETTMPRGEVATWLWEEHEDFAPTMAAVWPEAATVGFFIVDGLRNPVDQIEAFKPWLAGQGLELARVVCVFHCALVAEHERLRAWYDACVHFSDIVLLNRREGVENKWISELRTRFSKSYLPCLVEMVKKGRVANPALVLDLQVRRYSHWFDADENPWSGLVDDDTEIIIEDEEDPKGRGSADEELDFDEEDTYLARHPSGLRKKDIPDIAKILK
ncbi:hypothetical protein [Actomonas aquatica]|uniref:CobW/HypB/UreG nucleotide-binding domain-containing protein n=1 Tax=Actomonas aquatica TaxID=2866162 RepID=A0ABZ1C8V9_9BACT|nr:hypothetical protein [Opitutus sp. WL0086]WRQ87009.1 hypothetical protein K1X11_019520 [Opitutus sp. WL0086]